MKSALLVTMRPRKGARIYDSSRVPREDKERLVVCLAKIRSVNEIAYWMTILSVSCPQRIVVRGYVANSSHEIK